MKNIFLYLFVFSFLINVFQYVNSTKILESKDREVTKAKMHLQQSRDSLMEAQYNDYFDIANDEDAQEYFYSQNLDYQKVMQKVNEDLVSLNTNKEGNPLVPYEPIDGKQFIVNKAKVLNHRWIIAEYSNGELWGQILVKYFFKDGEPTDFQTVDTVLYEKQKIE
ncbi:hydrolase [Flavobacterium okayamense]|uniref:Hydrolase n=1 Tax=Flavobacterium okayamense TaxID=2830782 RepID=A0ABM7S858_9FLAO|nr:hydrolase [Flavobacterium okayamense]BCY28907.1 hypothetical protein KK2020170_17750 [Flavobacterium okayamense]